MESKNTLDRGLSMVMKEDENTNGGLDKGAIDAQLEVRGWFIYLIANDLGDAGSDQAATGTDWNSGWHGPERSERGPWPPHACSFPCSIRSLSP